MKSNGASLVLRLTKIILIAAVAAFLLVGAFSNVTDWGGTMGAVAAVTSMATVDGGANGWRATTSPVVIWLGALFILLLKVAAGLLCVTGASRMWAARKDDAAAFATAKELALAGCAIAIFMLFAGWIVIAETWFELWRSDSMRSLALETAFRYGGMIALIALFVATRED